MADPRDPIKVTVEFHPETGTKRSYEIWLHYMSGNKRRSASYKTEENANKVADEIKNRFNLH